MVIEADAIKNRDAMYKHLSSSDFTRNDPMLSSYVHEYSTKAAETMLAAAGDSPRSRLQQAYLSYLPAYLTQSAGMHRPAGRFYALATVCARHIQNIPWPSSAAVPMSCSTPAMDNHKCLCVCVP